MLRLDMDLPGLILRLIRMAYTQDSRTNQVCKALIGKALLAERWSENANGVLLYIDMIRYNPCSFRKVQMLTSAKNFKVKERAL